MGVKYKTMPSIVTAVLSYIKTLSNNFITPSLKRLNGQLKKRFIKDLVNVSLKKVV